MPYATDTVYLTLGGALPGNEQWQIGFHCQGVQPDMTQTNLQAAVDGAQPKVAAWWAASGSAIARVSGTTLSRITAYAIHANQTNAYRVAQAQFAPLAGSQSQALPNQCAVVATMLTNDPGRKGKGRVYIPCLNAAMTGPQLTAAVVTDIAAAFKALVVGLNSVAALQPVLGGTSGSPVTGIKVDSIIDTQRRRRNSLLPATVSSQTIP